MKTICIHIHARAKAYPATPDRRCPGSMRRQLASSTVPVTPLAAVTRRRGSFNTPQRNPMHSFFNFPPEIFQHSYPAQIISFLFRIKLHYHATEYPSTVSTQPIYFPQEIFTHHSFEIVRENIMHIHFTPRVTHSLVFQSCSVVHTLASCIIVLSNDFLFP